MHVDANIIGMCAANEILPLKFSGGTKLIPAKIIQHNITLVG